jgi:hypothetical protein
MQYENSQPMAPHPCFTPDMMRDMAACQPMYPEVYYKMVPHVVMACDEMDMLGCMMPSQQMIRCMAERICQAVRRIHPEMADYGRSMQVQTQALGGPLEDLAAILLLNEFLRRRRVY